VLLGVSCAAGSACQAPRPPELEETRAPPSTLAMSSRPLAGPWKFRELAGDDQGPSPLGARARDWLPASVPGTVHTDLLAAQLIDDPFFGQNERDQQWIGERDWEYQTTLPADAALLAREHVELVFEGLDTYATVLIDGTPLLTANNRFRRWRVPIRSELHAGDNVLTVRFRSALAEGKAASARLGYELPASNDRGDPKVSVFARKAPYSYGWDWGPRFVTSGIWRPVHLEAWDDVRLLDVQVVTEALSDERADLAISSTIVASRAGPAQLDFSLASGDALGSARAQLHPGENRVQARVHIDHPERWWPNGLGAQRLYEIETRLALSGVQKDERRLRVGLRTVEVEHRLDPGGKSFSIRVNGEPVFMKGANYIPEDSFLPRVTSERYERTLRAAAAVHMNMLRVWGGGVYADDRFYALADELGLLVWQDFMFACSMYPSDAAFLENVWAEARDNVRRLRNHPSLALWAGNNENEWGWRDWGWQQPLSEPQRAQVSAGYRRIFRELLPEIVAVEDPGRFYTQSTPSANEAGIAPNQLGFGDAHYWGVWGGNEPYEKYADNVSRFMSEYGFQSLPELATVQRYSPPAERRVDSDVMRAHQRHPRGAELIATYLARDFKPPRDFESYLYVTQVLQATVIQFAAEAHRRKMPFNAGSLYWQLDDTWPGASWSSIDYFGRWKALQYAARRFFAPLLASTSVEQGVLRVYGVSDRRRATPAHLALRLLDFEGRALWSKALDVELAPNTSQVYFEAPEAELLGTAARQRVVFVAELTDAEGKASRSVHYFEKAKDLALPRPELRIERQSENATGASLRVSARRLARAVWLSSDAASGSFDDNYFDLLPGESVRVEYHGPKGAKLRARSLRDSY
jgi:beta-mannosidase